MSECDRETSYRRPRSTRAVESRKKNDLATRISPYVWCHGKQRSRVFQFAVSRCSRVLLRCSAAG